MCGVLSHGHAQTSIHMTLIWAKVLLAWAAHLTGSMASWMLGAQWLVLAAQHEAPEGKRLVSKDTPGCRSRRAWPAVVSAPQDRAGCQQSVGIAVGPSGSLLPRAQPASTQAVFPGTAEGREQLWQPKQLLQATAQGFSLILISLLIGNARKAKSPRSWEWCRLRKVGAPCLHCSQLEEVGVPTQGTRPVGRATGEARLGRGGVCQPLQPSWQGTPPQFLI